MLAKTRIEGKKVLIVDDEADVINTLKGLLSRCVITAAGSLEEGRAFLESKSFDIAIFDIAGADGYELLRIARKKEVIAVMLTARTVAPRDIIKCRNEGVALYIPKDRIGEIERCLDDVFEAKEKNKSTWWRWVDRFGSYCELKFGSDWKENDKEYWDKFSEWM
jgi:CheY-like chemotaxis protein